MASRTTRNDTLVGCTASSNGIYETAYLTCTQICKDQPVKGVYWYVRVIWNMSTHCVDKMYIFLMLQQIAYTVVADYHYYCYWHYYYQPVVTRLLWYLSTTLKYHNNVTNLIHFHFHNHFIVCSTHNLQPANSYNCTQLTPKTASVVPPEDGRLTPETCRG
jgi:hypothetical protein